MKISTLSLLWIILFTTLFISCDESESDIDNKNTVVDIDGNVYHTVTIGSQVWMVENLKTSSFRNGEPISYIFRPTPIGGYGGGYGYPAINGYCNYNDDEEIANKYGRLYDWETIRDVRTIAPEGWHIPTKEEWAELARNASAKELASKTDWLTSSQPRTAGNDLSLNNSTSFNGLPGGLLNAGNEYLKLGESANWWCSDDSIMVDENHTIGYYFFIDFGENDNSGELKGWFSSLEYCYSVRCIKD